MTVSPALRATLLSPNLTRKTDMNEYDFEPEDFDNLPTTEMDDLERWELQELDRDLASEFDDWQDR